MTEKPLSILISGAGVAGASLALMLARHPSFKVKPTITLIERSTERRTTGQAIDIRGPGVDVIRKLGLEPAVKARHTSETGFELVDVKGASIAQFDATGDTKQQSVTSEYEILRSEMVSLLLDDIHASKANGANVNMVHGESIESMDESETGVHVTFAHGKLSPQTFDVVLGADGYGSKTRTLMFGKGDFIKATGWYIGFFTIPRIPSDDDLYHMCLLPGGLSMHLRPHRNKTTMGAYLGLMNGTKAANPEIEAILRSDIPTQKKYLQARFKDAGYQAERFTAALDAADDFYMSHWCQVRTPQWTQRRVAILGDAAFATMGIGTSLALISAYLISGELSQIKSSADVPSALAKYQEKFKPFVDKNSWSVPGFPQIMSPQSKWAIWMLHFVFRVVVALRIPKVLAMLFSGEDKEGWKLPEYGWEKKAEEAGESVNR